MSHTTIRLGPGRAMPVAVVAVATAFGFATGGPGAAFIPAVVGFFAAKSVESLQRAFP